MPIFKRPWGKKLNDLRGIPPYPYTKEELAEYRAKAGGPNCYMAWRYLCSTTGQDFGLDADKWEAWLEEHPDSFELTEETMRKALDPSRNREYLREFLQKRTSHNGRTFGESWATKECWP